MLRRITSFLLLLVTVFSVTKNSALYVLYELDTPTFVSWFCENKARPQLKCNGTCKLTQMAEEEEKKDIEKIFLSQHSEMFFFYQKRIALFNDIPLVEKSQAPFAPLCNLYSYLFLSRTDKPPQFLS